jgi:hypothetical protein
MEQLIIVLHEPWAETGIRDGQLSIPWPSNLRSFFFILQVVWSAVQMPYYSASCFKTGPQFFSRQKVLLLLSTVAVWYWVLANKVKL